MSNLSVVEKDGALVVDSRLVADRLNLDHHDWFNNVVLRYQTQMEQAFGILRFENAKINGRGRPKKFVFLTEDQATFVMTLSRNTPEVVECKIALVKAFSEAKRQLQTPALVPQFSRLDRLEMEIQEGIELMEAGKARIWQAAATIHAEQLWKERGFKSFEEYCHVRWGWKKSNAWEITRAGKVTVQLQRAGVKPEELPTAVAQIRQLSFDSTLPSQLRSLEIDPKTLIDFSKMEVSDAAHLAVSLLLAVMSLQAWRSTRQVIEVEPLGHSQIEVEPRDVGVGFAPERSNGSGSRQPVSWFRSPGGGAVPTPRIRSKNRIKPMSRNEAKSPRRTRSRTALQPPRLGDGCPPGDVP